MKRLFLMILALIILVTLFAGCAGTQKDEQSTATDATAAGTTGVAASAPADISVFLIKHPDDIITDDSPWTQQVNKLLNIKLHIILTPDEVVNDRMAVLLASSDVPDLVNVRPNTANIYGAAGVFLNADGLINQYENNNLKALLDKKLTSSLRDEKGDMYVLCGYNNSMKYPSQGIDYRKDILDKWGMNEPESMEEWYSVWKKYKSEYPDSTAFINIQTNVLAYFSAAFGITDFSFRFGLTDNFTKVEFSPTTDKFKQMLQFVNKLYNEGLMNKDFVTMQFTDYWNKIITGKAFSWGSSFARSSYADVEAAKVGVTMKSVGALNPKDQNGERHIYITPDIFIPEYAFAVSAKSEVVKDIIRFLDWTFSEEGTATIMYGLEGEAWKKEDGKIVKMVDDAQLPELFKKNGGGNGQPVYLSRAVTTEELMFSPSGWVEMIAGMKKNYEIATNLPIYTIKDTAASKEFNDIFTPIDTYMTQAAIEFIMGKRSFDQWDEYVKGYDALNLKRAIEIKQNALDEYYSTIEK